jgi:hypothetical protein
MLDRDQAADGCILVFGEELRPTIYDPRAEA